MHFLRYTMLLLKKQFDSPEYNPTLELLEKATIQYIKMAMINERLLKYSPSQLAFGAFSNACKYILDATNLWTKPQMDKIHNFFKELMEGVNCDEPKVTKCHKDLLEFLVNYKAYYKECDNILKFTLLKE